MQDDDLLFVWYSIKWSLFCLVVAALRSNHLTREFYIHWGQHPIILEMDCPLLSRKNLFSWIAGCGQCILASPCMLPFFTPTTSRSEMRKRQTLDVQSLKEYPTSYHFLRIRHYWLWTQLRAVIQQYKAEDDSGKNGAFIFVRRYRKLESCQWADVSMTRVSSYSRMAFSKQTSYLQGNQR